MNRWKRLLTSAVTAVMVSGLLLINVFAQPDYTYTVSFYAGNQGSFSGSGGLSVSSKGQAQIASDGNRITVSGLLEGDVVTFDVNQGDITLQEDSKYYVQGLRLSGRDNDGALAANSFRVTGDEDYVVAYGIRGEMTEYTVYYVDEDGNELAPSQTYYGNVGDKPVVAYQYVEGFTPQALTLTGTLSANQAENQFTFTYRANPVEVTPGETVTVTTTVPGTTEVVTTTVSAAGTGVTGTGAGTDEGTQGTGTGTTAGQGGTAGTGTGTTAGQAGTADAGTAAGQAGTAGTGTGTTAGQAGTAGTGTAAGQAGTGDVVTPQEGDTEVIEEDDTPLGQIDLDEESEEEDTQDDVQEESTKKGFPVAGVVGGAAAAALVAGAIILARMKLR